MFRTLCLADAVFVVNNMRARDRDCLHAVCELTPDLFALNRWQTDGPAWTLSEHEPVAIGGVCMPVPWIGRFWMVATDGMTQQAWKKLIRHARTVLRNASKTVRRLEAEVLSTWPEAQRFVARLGFELECSRAGAGRDGQDILIYVYRGR